MHVNPRLALLCALIVGVSTTTLADTLVGKVVGVADGDTITVLDGQQTQHKIRLMGIDARKRLNPSARIPSKACPTWCSTAQ